ncbi:uncharacterized protein LOC125376924 [Haliotis rufescens]|uniref:uncharacterized protein LOC125376924 n=1 Tax=Haliotis rufescens TaxID=6454 RepID=UPI00201E8221|nr:uncharacterized protein LOC125376924 [Haliotis rufescens]
MSSFFIVAILLVGVSCEHNHHDSHEIYTNVIENVWLSSDDNGDGIFERFELTLVFAHYDENGDKIVTHHEYMDSVPAHSTLREYSHAVFKEFDANDDDLLDTPDIDLVYGKMDLDGNKEVSKDEFTAYWMNILTKTAHLHGHGLHLGHHN